MQGRTVRVKVPATGSRAAHAPAPPVISLTRTTTSSLVDTMTSSALRRVQMNNVSCLQDGSHFIIGARLDVLLD